MPLPHRRPSRSRRTPPPSPVPEGLEARRLMSVTVFADGFEGASLSGWSTRTYGGAGSDAKWGLNTVKRYAGGKSAFVAGAGRNAYESDQHTGLVRENVSLAGYGTASLTFKYYLNTEAGYDFFAVNVIDGKGKATSVFRDSGDERDRGWRSKTINLDAFAGRSDLDVEFRFDSDASLVNEAPSGVWVDDVRLTATTRPATGTIRGSVFDDADGDRVHDAGEKPLSGWVVYLDRNQNRRRDANEWWRVTDKAGRYTFAGVAPGTHYVAQELKPGYAQTAPVKANVSGASQFGINVHFSDSSLTRTQRAAFSAAAARWSRVIVGDLPDVREDGLLIDDLYVDAAARDIDGRGGTLAQASPSGFREGAGPGGNLPYRGFVEVDAADIAALESSGQLLDVLTHEMAHVIGFGTAWEQAGLLRDAGGTNPRFTGPVATAQYNAIFGRAETGVPVENAGGPGTHDTHWRESAFGNELLTGYINKGKNPISRVTVGSLADLGYVVDLSAADVYAAPGRTPPPAPAGVVHAVSVSAGQTRSGIDFGNRAAGKPPAAAAVSGTVYRDADNDGVRDAGEAGLAGARVYADANNNGRHDSGERSVTSDAAGRYTLSGLAAGTYTVRFVAPANTAPTAPASGRHVVTLGAGQAVSGRDFGAVPAGKISGRIFNDVNANGVRDANEGGASGFRVYLDADRDGRFDAGEASHVVGAGGTYSFAGLRPGLHVVRYVAQAGWRNSYVYSNYAITLGVGQNRSAINFGVTRSA